MSVARTKHGDITFTDDDVVNIDEYIRAGGYNPHKVVPWLIHDHGFAVAVVFANNLQDAFDEAVDANKLDAFMVSEEDLKDYGPDEDGIVRLGNASEPFDIEALEGVELVNPPLSFAALYDAAAKAVVS